ncbi:Cyclin-dependent kinases regulatory subunit like [Actinidia chinensis var. chinensis]|uniref:Cyclin-dependent kinases regulatory subunit like n=1 Tax=Actinidia chinensis var. chinensis TaxID=1590841 RepID=A0A2R6P7E5_ACTCC|nr:Cyclin-dependent kinases regulatory subunit like [Actinidia chinensis var. chinensis]
MNGVRLGCSRAEGGSIMQFIDRSHTSCSSGGPSTISSSSRRIRLSKTWFPSEIMSLSLSSLSLWKLLSSFHLEMNSFNVIPCIRRCTFTMCFSQLWKISS